MVQAESIEKESPVVENQSTDDEPQTWADEEILKSFQDCSVIKIGVYYVNRK